MGRQPFLPTFAKKQYRVGWQSIAGHPPLAALLGNMVSLWAYVDNEIAGLFAALLTTESEAAYAVFAALRRWSNQREALDAAANTKLKSDELDLYTVLIEKYGALESERSFIVHGCTGTCADDPNLLLVISVKHHALWQADILPKHIAGKIPEDSHRGLKENLFVYRMKDIVEILKEMEQLWWDLFYLNGYLRNRDEPRRVAEFRKLFDSPRIQQRISALKQSRSRKAP